MLVVFLAVFAVWCPADAARAVTIPDTGMAAITVGEEQGQAATDATGGVMKKLTAVAPEKYMKNIGKVSSALARCSLLVAPFHLELLNRRLPSLTVTP